MGQTISEKILSRTSGETARAGEYVNANPDMVLFCDMQWQHSIERALHDIGLEKIRQPERVVVVIDHRTPANIPYQANEQRNLRLFAKEKGIKHFYDVGRNGLRNHVVVEQGLVWPGMLVVSDEPAISSTLGAFGALGFGSAIRVIEAMATGETWFRVPQTFRIVLSGTFHNGVQARDLALRISSDLGTEGVKDEVIEFTGSAIDHFNVDERMSLCQQMPLDTGAHAAVMAPDQTALDYLKAKSVKDPKPIVPDGDAQYYETASYDIAELEPYVSPPPSPATGRPVSQVTGARVDQAYIGSCSGGRLTDLRIAAEILRGRKVHPDTRMIVTPITQKTYKEAVKEGIIETLIEADVVIGPPGCGACPGAHMGAMGAEETVISTTSMNYPGRMGDPAAKIYLASAYTVAASAVKGKITDPREFLS